MLSITGMKGWLFDVVAELITMAHGGGGPVMASLIDEITEILGMEAHQRHDAAPLPPLAGQAMMTTDSFVVKPLFFPGGDIGKLAVCGTVNDLAMAGARALAISLAFILEEGLPLQVLRHVVRSVAETAKEAGVQVVTGDVKVVERGSADGLYINTAGVGLVRPALCLHSRRVQLGDKVVVSGPLGEHGAAILAEREGINNGQLVSDVAAVWPQVDALLEAVPDTRVLRDPTRGGLAAALREIAAVANVAFDLYETFLPVKGPVRSFCELLGIDPLHMACEGRFLAVVPEGSEEKAVAALQKAPGGAEAAVVGQAVPQGTAGGVRLVSAYGGYVYLPAGEGELLPRIC